MNTFKNIDINSLKRLALKYSQNVPRYTSYPTVLELQTNFNIKKLEETLKNKSAPLSAYIHIPFCRTICNFCACNRVTCKDSNEKRNYLKALIHEIEIITAKNTAPISSIHIGGGSPSFLDLEEFSYLMENLSLKLANPLKDRDIINKSIELDPRTTTIDKIQLLKSYGFNRASLGIQDFDNTVQKKIGRIQSFELVRDMVSYLRENNFKSINFDLIYGLPKQSVDSLQKTLDLTIQLKPERIALYGFAFVPWKSKNQTKINPQDLPSPEERLTLLLNSIKKLQDNGYEYIGLDHFALPDDQLAISRKKNNLHRNFMGYTTDQTSGVIAFGASGISDLNGMLCQNYPDIGQYQSSLVNNKLPISKAYFRSIEDMIRSKLIEMIMTSDLIKRDRLINSFDQKLSEHVCRIFSETQNKLKTFEEDLLISLDKDAFSIMPLGRFFIRTIAASVDTYLEKYNNKTSRSFSQGA